MWEALAESRRRCGRVEPGPGADVAGASPVPVQMWQGRAKSWCRCGRVLGSRRLRANCTVWASERSAGAYSGARRDVMAWLRLLMPSHVWLVHHELLLTAYRGHIAAEGPPRHIVPRLTNRHPPVEAHTPLPTRAQS